MIVGVGSAPPRLLEELRKYVKHPRVFIWPEFFDSKRELIEKRYARYVEKVLAYRHGIVIALWPDYLYEDKFGLCSYDILWIFPLHSLSELDKLRARCIAFLGYPSQREATISGQRVVLRDYDIRSFLDAAEQLGYSTWYLGANSREIYEAVAHRFDGVDVTTLSIPGWGYRHNLGPGAAAVIARWLEALAEGRILRSRNGKLIEVRPLPVSKA